MLEVGDRAVIMRRNLAWREDSKTGCSDQDTSESLQTRHKAFDAIVEETINFRGDFDSSVSLVTVSRTSEWSRPIRSDSGMINDLALG